MHSPLPAPRRRRRAALIALLATLLTLGLVEGLARIALGPEDLVPNPALPWLRDDARLLWALPAELDLRTSEGWTLRTNALGLREDEVAIPKPQGVVRVLSLGEGAAMGRGVEAEQTYAAVLEERLNGPRGPRRRGGAVEVLNAGVAGYSLWQSAEYLAIRGLALQPDVVMVYALASDMMPLGVPDPQGFLLRQDATDRALIERRRLLAPLRAALQVSHLWRGARTWWVRSSTPPPHPELGTGTPTGARVPQADRLFALDRMLALCQANGAELLVIVPSYGGKLFGSDTVLRNFAQQKRVPYVDLPKIRSRYAVPDALFFQSDGLNPSARGHQMIAERLEDELARMGY